MPKKRSTQKPSAKKRKKTHKHDPHVLGLAIACWDPRCGAHPGQVVYTAPPTDFR